VIALIATYRAAPGVADARLESRTVAVYELLGDSNS
jgi:hypothetical protein